MCARGGSIGRTHRSRPRDVSRRSSVSDTGHQGRATRCGDSRHGNRRGSLITELSKQQRRNEKRMAGGGGDPRENPPTSCILIVSQDYVKICPKSLCSPPIHITQASFYGCISIGYNTEKSETGDVIVNSGTVSGHQETITEWSSVEMKGRVKREIPEKTRRPAASSGTIPTCENPGVIPPAYRKLNCVRNHLRDTPGVKRKVLKLRPANIAGLQQQHTNQKRGIQFSTPPASNLAHHTSGGVPDGRDVTGDAVKTRLQFLSRRPRCELTSRTNHGAVIRPVKSSLPPPPCIIPHRGAGFVNGGTPGYKPRPGRRKARGMALRGCARRQGGGRCMQRHTGLANKLFLQYNCRRVEKEGVLGGGGGCKTVSVEHHTAESLPRVECRMGMGYCATLLVCQARGMITNRECVYSCCKTRGRKLFAGGRMCLPARGGNGAGQCRSAVGFLGDHPFTPYLHSSADSSSSALKTKLRDAQKYLHSLTRRWASPACSGRRGNLGSWVKGGVDNAKRGLRGLKRGATGRGDVSVPRRQDRARQGSVACRLVIKQATRRRPRLFPSPLLV
ncbi:hypothetical protein PR048_027594 [Dryococelus australis]|uniref:Uncharacterized protein n=1 Tax=Dryococelus australis TaxID=614101 RepID=A0ABQ9GGZ4_9NEOP|nr:hypothetical protein PR048_027594 [Dryococelus australis]